MSRTDDYSPDEPLGTEVFEQGDEALSEQARLDPEFMEELDQDPSLEPALELDDRELEELGLKLDDPESLAVLDGGMDDPDGTGGPRAGATGPAGEDDGWDLDAPVTSAAAGAAADEEDDLQ
jgi:hypothetical protein